MTISHILPKLLTMQDRIKVVAFDADDTLWENETYFREAEAKFGQLLGKYIDTKDLNDNLLKIEIDNLPIYGFGIKAFMLSMVEAAIKLTNRQVSNEDILQIIAIGQEMLNKPVVLLTGVEEVLQSLQGKYRLVLATKGDLLDQETKLRKSGLESYFHHIEILSDKKLGNYQRFVQHLDIKPSEFLMVGNSMKSDILPILELGGYACHVPFHTTWEYEKVQDPVKHERLIALTKINELLGHI